MPHALTYFPLKFLKDKHGLHLELKSTAIVFFRNIIPIGKFVDPVEVVHSVLLQLQRPCHVVTSVVKLHGLEQFDLLSADMQSLNKTHLKTNN